MKITSLSITGLRNLESMTIKPVPGINQLIGENGAGKTTILEAIYLLSSGRSFRTRKIPRLLAEGVDELSVRMEFTDPETRVEHQAGILKTRDGDTTLKLDYQSLNSIVEVTRLLPVKIINPDSHKLVQEGPDQRREFLDWGVFHVEQSFFQTWKQFRRALQQRNQILRTHTGGNELTAWDRELAVSGTMVNEMRARYVDKLQPIVESFVSEFGMLQTIRLKYRAGWGKDLTLIQALSNEQDQDIPPAFTTVGPHRAELALTANGTAAKDILSRGEQKLLVYALHFAQLKLYSASTDRQPVVLLDDLAAELDLVFTKKVIASLLQMGVQAFISGNEPLRSGNLEKHGIHQIIQGNLAEVV